MKLRTYTYPKAKEHQLKIGDFDLWVFPPIRQIDTRARQWKKLITINK